MSCLLFSWRCFANDCTHQLDGYIKKLEAITDSPYLTDAHKQQARNELQTIIQLRHQLSDCDLAKQIPALNKNREATTSGDSEQVKAQ